MCIGVRMCMWNLYWITEILFTAKIVSCLTATNSAMYLFIDSGDDGGGGQEP